MYCYVIWLDDIINIWLVLRYGILEGEIYVSALVVQKQMNFTHWSKVNRIGRDRTAVWGCADLLTHTTLVTSNVFSILNFVCGCVHVRNTTPSLVSGFTHTHTHTHAHARTHIHTHTVKSFVVIVLIIIFLFLSLVSFFSFSVCYHDRFFWGVSLQHLFPLLILLRS